LLLRQLRQNPPKTAEQQPGDDTDTNPPPTFSGVARELSDSRLITIWRDGDNL
jgi:hypothetical protein